MQKTIAIGEPLPSFSLKATDGKTYTQDDFSGAEILIIAFMCNHCPYVQAYENRLIDLQKKYAGKVKLAAVNPNDDEAYPEDSFDNMVIRAEERGFNFPYLRDEEQSLAKAFGATHTPEIFLFDRNRKLAFHGKIDDNWRSEESVTEFYLRDAIDELLSGRSVSIPETFTLGCTIKWKDSFQQRNE